MYTICHNGIHGATWDCGFRHSASSRGTARHGIAFEALDNGVASGAEPARLQRICDGLSAAKIDAVVRKWLGRIPVPFRGKDRSAGYRYDLSVLQSEFSLIQVPDRPVTGRICFERVIRDNLDLGRPDRVQLIFARRTTKRTPGRFRTRVLTNGVIPTLHVSYKHSDIKQYHKEGRGLRTETTINDTHATSASASGSATLLHCGRSASKPTDDFWTSNESATIAMSAKRCGPR